MYHHHKSHKSKHFPYEHMYLLITKNTLSVRYEISDIYVFANMSMCEQDLT